MTRIKKLLCLLMICSAGNAEYVLQSELKKNYNDGSPTSFFTGYTYDIRGNRIEKTVFDGKDSSATLLSATEYQYDETSGLLQKEILLSDHDTASEVVYSYDEKNNVRAIILRNHGVTETCRDSLFYDETGNCIRKIRYYSGEQRYYHAYTLNNAGNRTADTLYEYKDGAFYPTMAIVFLYGENGLVQSEKVYQKPADEWLPIKCALMAYKGSVLSSVTVFEGDASQNRLVDSTAYLFDDFGNKVNEQKFNDQRNLLFSIDYSWSTNIAIQPRKKPVKKPAIIVRTKNEIRLSSDNLSGVRGCIYDMQGRLVFDSGNSSSPEKTTLFMHSLKTGHYIVRLKGNDITTTQKITILK